jgi:hypothetical protein
VVLDLRRVGVRSPSHVAGVLWVEDTARALGVALEIVTPDMVSAEMLDFAGVTVPLHAGTLPPARTGPAVPLRDSAY